MPTGPPAFWMARSPRAPSGFAPEEEHTSSARTEDKQYVLFAPANSTIISHCPLMTSMAGSSRTLYQASLDGWPPSYLAKADQHGAPTNAMLTNFIFNLLLLLLSNTMSQ